MKNLLLDGSIVDGWSLLLDDDVKAQFVHLVPGKMYTLTLRQDSVGGHTFTWPSNCINMSTADPQPHSTTVQLAICLLNGKLRQLVPTVPESWNNYTAITEA